MIGRFLLFLLWFLVWSCLSWPPDTRDIITGVFVSLFVTFMTAGMPVEKSRSLKSPVCCLWFFYYILVFVWECVKANIDVAYRVVHPALPIRPGTVKVRTSLRSDIGLTFLANSVTLTPGTTSIDIDKDNGILYVHRLYIADDGKDASAGLAVVEKFEKILKKIFE